MKLRLRSNFWDYYDTAFASPLSDGPVFERIGGHAGPPKREQLALLDEAGFRTPPHGLVKDVVGQWWESEKQWVRYVVAYEDEMAHCAEGKRVLTPDHYRTGGIMGGPRLTEALRLNDLYCTACLGWPIRQGLSWRRLQIGPHVFWLEYKSTKSWMSNVDGACEVIGSEMDAGFHPVIRRPLFAVDFVIGRELYAVDLNYGPGVRGSGVEDRMSANDVVSAIARWFEANHSF